jgi:hypothetical protein
MRIPMIGHISITAGPVGWAIKRPGRGIYICMGRVMIALGV